MFAEAGKRGLVRMLVINRIDADNIHLDELLRVIRDSLGKNCVLFNVPNAVGPAFSSVISVLNPPASLPSGLPVDLAAERSRLIDAIVESDEALMEKYLGEGDVSADELTAALPKAMAAGTIVPIFCTIDEGGQGHRRTGIARRLAQFAPSPKAGPQRKGTKGSGDKAAEVAIEADEAGEFVGEVFKTISDKFVGNLSYLRVLSGKMAPDQPIVNQRTGKSGRSSGLLLPQGKTTKAVTEAMPGDIVAVAKVEDLHIGDTVSNHPDAPKLPLPRFPTPMFGLAIEPKNRGDEAEDFRQLAQDRRRRSNVPGHARHANQGDGHHRHEPAPPRRRAEAAQGPLRPGGHHPRAENSLPRNDCRDGRGGAPAQEAERRPRPVRQGTPAHLPDSGPAYSQQGGVLREVRQQDASSRRFVWTAAITSRSTISASSTTSSAARSPTSSSPRSRRAARSCWRPVPSPAIASRTWRSRSTSARTTTWTAPKPRSRPPGRMAFKKAFLAAHPVLLEPIVNLEVTVPSKYTGAILSDLNTKRARIENQDSLPGDLAVIMAKAPLAEVTRYAAQLGSITQGKGSYTMEFSHYDMVPGNVQQQIVSKAKLAHDEEE